MIYIYIFLFCYLLVVIKEHVDGNNLYLESKNQRVGNVLFIVFIVLWGISSFRYDTGVDYITYSTYQIPEILSGNYMLEPLSNVLFLVGHKLAGDPGVFSLISFLSLFFVMKSIYNLSVDKSFSILIFFISGFFNISLNLMRQSIAIAIFLFATKYIFDRKLIKYIIALGIAFCFHKTAIVFLPLFFLYGIRFSLKRLIIFLTASYPILYILNTLLLKITTTLGFYTNYWGNREMQSTNKFSGSYTILNLFILVFMMIVYKGSKKYAVKQQKIIDFYIYMQIICIEVILFAYEFYLPNFDRFLLMFSTSQIISVPLFANMLKDKLIRIVAFFLIVIIYVVIFYLVIYQKNTTGTFPYHSLFDY